MVYEIFPQGARQLTITIDERGLQIRRFWRYRRFLAWERITGAALDTTEFVTLPEGFPLGELIPGYRWLIRFNNRTINCL